MRQKISIIYNDPLPSKYRGLGEDEAICGVLEEVKAVNEALLSLEYETTQVALQPPLSAVRARLEALDADVVFNLFEGFDGHPGTEAEVARIMEDLGICFTGSPSSAIALAQNKALAKQTMRASGIPTADYQVLTPKTVSRFRLHFPCMTKPLDEDASHGISADSVVNDRQSLERQVKALHRDYGCATLVEEFLDGREFNATVVGVDMLRVLPPSEIVYALAPGLPRILTYLAKWETEAEYYKGTQVECPADIDMALAEEINNLAISAFRAMGCRGYARADMRQNSAGQLMVLEVNPNPDISLHAGMSRQIVVAGLSYAEFIEMQVRWAAANQQSDVVNKSCISL